MKPGYLALMAACVLLSSCAGKLAMVGFDKYGKSTQVFVNDEKYVEHVTEALCRIEESVYPALTAAPTDVEWKLRTAVVGFGLKAEAGIGPFKVAVKPRIRAAFTN